MLRLYFNRHCELPWSIDEGTQDTERQFAGVATASVSGVCVAQPLLPGEDPAIKPSAWIEYLGCEVVVVAPDHAIIVKKR